MHGPHRLPANLVLLRGTGFVPGVPLTLAWNVGTAAGPPPVPDAAGRFELPLVLLRGFRGGVRNLTVSMPSIQDGVVPARPRPWSS